MTLTVKLKVHQKGRNSHGNSFWSLCFRWNLNLMFSEIEDKLYTRQKYVCVLLHSFNNLLVLGHFFNELLVSLFAWSQAYIGLASTLGRRVEDSLGECKTITWKLQAFATISWYSLLVSNIDSGTFCTAQFLCWSWFRCLCLWFSLYFIFLPCSI